MSVSGTDDCAANAGEFGLAAVAGREEAPVEGPFYLTIGLEALEEGDFEIADLSRALRRDIRDDAPVARLRLVR